MNTSIGPFVALLALAPAAAPDCGSVAISPSHDFAFLVGSSDTAGTYRWLRQGQPFKSGQTTQLFLLHADGSADAPLEARGVAFRPGRWGSALYLEPNGGLFYAREGQLNLEEGTVEMWVASRADGSDPIYAQRDHVLFQYRAPNGDDLRIAQSRTAGILYGGGTVRGQWESAYGSLASMRGWTAGEWHHLAFTWSAGGNFMRFYVDGVLTADTNEKHYWAPAATGDRFSLGAADYAIDEVRISSAAMDAAEVRANAGRLEAPRPNEVWLPLEGVSPGDAITLEVASCTSAAYLFRGIPIAEADPPSTLLPPGTTTLDVRLRSVAPANCRYSSGEPLAFDRMTPFETGGGTTRHSIQLTNLNPDTGAVNHVYLRCDSEPAYVHHLMYRSLPEVDPKFPRKGNLWGSGQLLPKGLEYCSRIDLWLGASFTPAQIRQLRAMNPGVLVLTSINVVENTGLPDDYYLKDVHGRRIEVWPGSFRLNLTKRHVAEYQARYAYQRILDSGLMVDGCFFDNFFTTQSWLKQDIHGHAVQLDADEDGREDDPKWLDEAWRAGVYHELETWRSLMPHALASGHLPRPPTPDFSSIYNGDSIGFLTADAIEGKRSFADLWEAYHRWWEIGRRPVITMVESSPPDQIAYGYDYDPLRKTPPSTLEFARTYYPNVRFGLAFTLMNDGYFAHEFGDTWHGNDWWYDELDFDLGHALGPAERVAVEGFAGTEHLENGGFEAPLEPAWRLTLNAASGVAARVERDTADAAEGAASARITITNRGQGVDWHIDFNQRDRSLTRGVSYDLEFQAKSDAARTISLSAQKGSPDWRNYGLSRRVELTTGWRKYTVTFEANETVSDSRIQFFLGAQTGVVWLDGVRLVEHPPDIYRREFANGAALVNGARSRQTVALGPGYSRLEGPQAPRYEYILDDDSPAFSASGEWKEVSYDSGEWKAAGPFYHDWGKACHQLDGTAGQAQWDLELRADDTYTIAAWWPAAPASNSWSRRVVFEVLAAGAVVASTAVDQTAGGDEWHVIATVPLAKADRPLVRVRNEGSGPAIADALHVRSASRYNDGSPAPAITLEPMDGIVLRRTPPP